MEKTIPYNVAYLLAGREALKHNEHKAECWLTEKESFSCVHRPGVRIAKGGPGRLRGLEVEVKLEGPTEVKPEDSRSRTRKRVGGGAEHSFVLPCKLTLEGPG